MEKFDRYLAMQGFVASPKDHADGPSRNLLLDEIASEMPGQPFVAR